MILFEFIKLLCNLYLSRFLTYLVSCASTTVTQHSDWTDRPPKLRETRWFKVSTLLIIAKHLSCFSGRLTSSILSSSLFHKLVRDIDEMSSHMKEEKTTFSSWKKGDEVMTKYVVYDFHRKNDY